MIGIGFFNISLLALRCLGWGHGGVRLFQCWLLQLVLYAAWGTRANYLPCRHWKALRRLSWSTAPAPSGCAVVQLTTVLYKACHGGHLTIRLALGGCTKWPFYHIVVPPTSVPRMAISWSSWAPMIQCPIIMERNSLLSTWTRCGIVLLMEPTSLSLWKSLWVFLAISLSI